MSADRVEMSVRELRLFNQRTAASRARNEKRCPMKFSPEFPKYAPLDVRFWRRVEKTDGCWLWRGGVNSTGYGQIGIGGGSRRLEYTHRLAYMLTRGPIPDGMQVCHTCDVRRCVNPAHLFVGTAFDNMRDMVAKGRHFSPGRDLPPITHCKRGHEFTPENTIRTSRGGRSCRACKKAWCRANPYDRSEYFQEWKRRRKARGAA